LSSAIGMSDTVDSLERIIECCANKYGFESATRDMQSLAALIINVINTTTITFLIEDHLADIDGNGIQIHEDFRSAFCINRFKTITYNSMDPSFRIIQNDNICTIRYTYNGQEYNSMQMEPFNIDFVSNYAFFHDVIFSFVLKQY
jgi:hypothetical protein